MTPSVTDKTLLDTIVELGGGTGIMDLPLVKEVELERERGVVSAIISRPLNS